MTPEPSSYEMHLTVTKEHIDQLGHVNNLVYMKWVQDIAIEHWMKEAPEADRTNLFWVVTRHEIDFKRQGFEGDRILVKTWVGRANRRLFERYTQIVREEDEKVLAECKTVWCPIDPKTGRPTVVSEDVRKRFSVD